MNLLKPVIKLFRLLFLFSGYLFFFGACNSDASKPAEKDIVTEPSKFREHLSGNIEKYCLSFAAGKGKMNDSVKLKYYEWLSDAYKKNEYTSFWSEDKKWKPAAGQLMQFIDNSMLYGLFPKDYHRNILHSLRDKFQQDSAEIMNAAAWAKAEVLLTDAFFMLARHLKLGHLPADSISVPKADSVYGKDFFTAQLQAALKSGNIHAVLDSLEPKQEQYHLIKAKLSTFLDTTRFTAATYIQYPYKDTVQFYFQLQKRLEELGYLKKAERNPDSVIIRSAILKYKKANNIKADSSFSESLVESLNDTEWGRFIRIAINLDRYRQLPDPMPSTYIFVNLPNYTLVVHDADSVAMESKVVVGNPKTRTPVLNSEVYEFITMPYWTVPNSIIMKEMLGKIIRNPGYLAKDGYVVLNSKAEEQDPYTIDWKKYLGKKAIPYLIRQNSGDDNSLGVIKFNFRNSFSVYMHDTNARGFFSRKSRALSHGCVRVQDWEKLAGFLTRNDTLRVKTDSLHFEKIPFSTDTLDAWISREERHFYSLKHRVPVFFRYITCEVKNDQLFFYSDIYKEDRMLREKYFLDKSF
jgi:murein L,D-transpeptidase YcbB/YkuD